MATERIDIVVSERGSRTVKRNLEEIGDTAKGTSSAVDQLKAALAFVGAAALAREVARLSDTYTELQNAIRLSGMAAGGTAKTFNEILSIANKTRSPLEAMTQLFQRGAMAANDLGASQQDLYRFTEAVGTALALQGGSAEQASGALLQLAQALGGGIVRAEEFNSVVEGAFPVAMAAARGLDAAGGSVSRLRTLVADGKVTSEEFFRAILSQLPELQRQFAQATPTIGQAFTVLRNNLVAFVGGLNDATGASAMASQAIMLFANNLDIVAKAAAVVGVGLATAFAPGILVAGINAVTGAVRVLTLAIASNPIGALLVVLTAATAAAYMFGDQIMVTGDGITSLRDVVVAVFSYISDAVTAITTWFSEAWDKSGGAVQKAVGGVMETIVSMGRTILSAYKTIINTYVGLWVGAYNTIINAWNLFPGAMRDLAVMAGNALIEVIGNAVQGVINAVQKLLSFIGSAATVVGMDNPFANLISPDGVKKSLDQYKGVVTGAAKEVGQIVRDEFGKSLGTDYVGVAAGGATEAVNAVLDRAQAIARDRVAAQKDADLSVPLASHEFVAPYGAPSGGAGSSGSKGRAKKETEELTAAEEKYKEVLESIQQPQKDFELTLAAANKLLSEGKINAEQHARAIRDVAIAAAEAAGGPLNGLKAGLLSLQRDSTDMAKDISDVVQNAFSGMEDALVEFVTTGKMDFGKLVDSIIADIARLIIRYMVIQPIIQALSGAFGGIFGGAAAPLPSFATGGGFTVGGAGGVDSQLVQFMASPGERVTVSRPGQSTSPAQAGGPVRTQVNVYNNGQPVQAQAETRQGPDGSLQIDVLLDQIEDRLSGRVAKGGSTINKALEGRYALDAARGLQR